MTLTQSPLDNKTELLLTELQNTFNISFEVWNKNYAEVFTQNNNAVISFNPKKVTAACVAHELLHVWLNQYEYLSGNYLRMSFLETPFLSEVFDKRLCDHIGNCMDHNKMYPKFREMGYSPESFIQNGGKSQCSISDVRSIFLKVNGKYSPAGVNSFIGHLISILADHCDNDYDKQLTMLQKRDQELFNVVTDFWQEWEAFDIEKIDAINNSDFDLMDRFRSNLESWCETKGIIEE
jgi:hypothetical protein